VITFLITVAIIALIAFYGYRAVRRLRKQDRVAEPPHIITSGKDGKWQVPIFQPDGPLFIKPWLQPGDNPVASAAGAVDSESLEVLFHVLRDKADKKQFEVAVEVPSTGKSFIVVPVKRAVVNHGVPEQVQYVARLSGLPAGTLFKYTVLMGGREVYSTYATTRKAQGEAFRAIVFGDMGNGSPGQRRLAYRLAQPAVGAANRLPYTKPQGADLIVATGDIVYNSGRYSEYLSKFFSVYNAEKAGPDTGASIIANTMMISCVGNHDVAKMDPETLVSFDEYPDLMAYYALWSLPLNGPDPDVLGATPPLEGNGTAVKAALASAAERFPRMSNYSYNFGCAHFLILDANVYMDWTKAKLRAWVEQDLQSVPEGIWKIVVLHQPPFTSNVGHQREQQMRFLADIFERNGVSIVFCGHAHSYERSFPLKFVSEGGIAPSAQLPGGYVPGSIVCDRSFDGAVSTKPTGVVYIVTGAGGAKLDSKNLQANPDLWQPFTAKLIGDRHTFTVVDFSPEKISVEQQDAEGAVLDSFVLSR
jgi:acid phosphatase type 7